MDRIAYFADLSVKRGCAFALLGIGTTMLGLSGDLLLSLKSGAVLATMMDAVLVLLATRALRADYRRTELWALLGKRHELPLPEDRVGAIIRGILHDTLIRYSRLALLSAALLWVLVVLVWAHRVL